MSDVKSVVVIISNPVGKGDTGECAEGWYFVENGVLTMTDREGVPLCDEYNGQRIAMRLLAGESEKAAAKRLTLKIHRAASRDEMSGFHRPIRYPQQAWA